MTQKNTTLSQMPTMYLERPAAAMLTPEFQEYTRQIVQAIGRLTKRSLKGVTGAIKSAFRYLNEKWAAAAEMDERVRAAREARYFHRNFPMIRGLL